MEQKIMSNLTISVVMATYNGEDYIQQQLNSIIPYLKKDDEIIISDDGSSDKTIELIKLYQNCYGNITLIDGPREGVVKNFENALRYSSKDIIMFADQDDIWLPTKFEIIRDAFQKNGDIELILHDMYMCSNSQIQNRNYGPGHFQIRKRCHGFFYNLLYSGYYGCCMSFRNELKNLILPFPNNLNMYDQLIGLVSESRHSSLFLDVPLIIHRIHGDNLTRRLTIIESLKYKLKLLISFIVFKRRVNK